MHGGKGLWLGQRQARASPCIRLRQEIRNLVLTLLVWDCRLSVCICGVLHSADHNIALSECPPPPPRTQPLVIGSVARCCGVGRTRGVSPRGLCKCRQALPRHVPHLQFVSTCTFRQFLRAHTNSGIAQALSQHDLPHLGRGQGKRLGWLPSRCLLRTGPLSLQGPS